MRLATSRSIFRPLALFAALNLVDLVTTWWALHLGAYEANPITAPFIHSYLVTAGVKVAVVAGASAMIWRQRGGLRRALGQAWFAVGIYSVVVLNNVEVIRLALTHH